MNFLTFRTDGQGGLSAAAEDGIPLSHDQVEVTVSAVSLNFRDIGFVKGNHHRRPNSGRVPCTDAVGVVSAVGPSVRRVQVGDRVSPTVLPRWIDGALTAAGFEASFGSDQRDGVLAQRITVNEEELVKVPEYLSDAEAATLPVAALTAWHAIMELDVAKPGDTVVIETAGGVALFALQFALAKNLRAIVTSRSAEKRAKLKALGAAFALDSSDPEWAKEVLTPTDGVGAQLVVDMGLADGLRRTCNAAAFEGTVAIVGVVQTRHACLDIFSVMNKNLRLRGVETGSRAMFERMNAFLRERELRPVIDSIYGIDEIPQAFERLTANPFGKVVIDMKHERFNGRTRQAPRPRTWQAMLGAWPHPLHYL